MQISNENNRDDTMIKFFLSVIAMICMLVSTGCITVYESDEPVVSKKFASDIKLRLEGFQLKSLQPTQFHTGYASTSTYNYQSGKWTTGGGTYSGTTYEFLPDENFSMIVKDAFELAGANIKASNMDLMIDGRIGNGRFMWKKPQLWYRDAPIFLFAVCTFGMALSCERENDVRLIVYNEEGKRVKEYYATASYHAVGIGLPLALFSNEKMYEYYGDRQAAKFALIKCINEFITDWNKGFYKTSASSKK